MPLVGAVGWLLLFFFRLSVSSDLLHESSHSRIQDEGVLPIWVSVFSWQRRLVQESSESCCLEPLSWHFYIYSNCQRRSWGQGQHQCDRGIYPPLASREGRLNICRTIRVYLKGYVWDPGCVYKVIWLDQGETELNQTTVYPSNGYGTREWAFAESCFWLWDCLGERLDVRKAVPELSLPLLLLGLAASVPHSPTSSPLRCSSRSVPGVWVDGESGFPKQQLDANLNTCCQVASESSSFFSSPHNNEMSFFMGLRLVIFKWDIVEWSLKLFPVSMVCDHGDLTSI